MTLGTNSLGGFMLTGFAILRRVGFVKRIQGTDLEVWSRAEPGDPS